MKALVQIAGIIDAREADLLLENGVDWLGFPLRLPSGKDDISEADARAIIAGLPAGRAGVLITYLDRADEIARFCDSLGCSAVQLHGEIGIDELARLRALRPDLTILAALVVREENRAELLTHIERTQAHVDMYITDTYDPATGARGATGKTHDWSISAALAHRSERPLMLAGGLNPANVAESIARVRPAGVDAHTAVEGPDGRKDPEKVRRFVQEAQRAFAAL
ncbi:phosphoribosylanthranilate isomerase [Millisia brevis]|uniref:phosphoribosylanthranilate isomerase n=1 Tax=Millisia brevis TaxID=264148 RepID=UPI00082A29B6|nr:phosphoribosylanthranilate isomerase [Millisia brevis]